MFKQVSTKALRVLNNESIRLGYNRNLADEFFADLKRGDTHLLRVLIVHEHAQGEPVPPHYRCRITTQMKGEPEPVQVLLDIPIESFNKLTDVHPSILARCGVPNYQATALTLGSL